MADELTYKTTSKKVVYTCITDRYDELINHKYMDSSWDYICFSDVNLSSSQNSAWQIVPLRNDKFDSARNQRWHKINPHKILKNYEHSLYLDANIEVISPDFFKMIEDCITNSVKIALPPHPKRDCIYDELSACIAAKKDNIDSMREQVRLIRSKGYPEHNGLFANGIIYRQHLDKKVVTIMNDWWEFVKDLSFRDQLSFAYVLWENHFHAFALKIRYYDNNQGLLYFWPHNSDARKVISELNYKLNHTDAKSDDYRIPGYARVKKWLSKIKSQLQSR